MRPAVVVAILALAAATTGCKKSVVPGCRAQCTCHPCTDTDLDTCVDRATTAQKAAEEKGCTEAFDTFLDCFEDTFSCASSGTFDCSHAQSALFVCSGNGNPFADECQQAAEKVNSCIPGANQPAAEPCTGVNECQAKCIIAASCDDLTGKQPGSHFTDCVNTCVGVPGKP
jgi:hypothetical protein